MRKRLWDSDLCVTVADRVIISELFTIFAGYRNVIIWTKEALYGIL